MSKFMNAGALADYLQIPKSSVYQLVFRSKHADCPIPYYKIGERVRFKKDEIDQWLEKQAVNGSGEYDNP